VDETGTTHAPLYVGSEMSNITQHQNPEDNTLNYFKSWLSWSSGRKKGIQNLWGQW